MKTFLVIAVQFCWINSALCQFTCFNQVTGEQGDLMSEFGSNVEVVNDSYVVWGGGIDTIGLMCFIRKYNMDGSVFDENIVYDEDEYFYTGITNSMQWNHYTNQFVVLQGADLGDVTEGRFLTFDEDLNLMDDLFYDEHPPNTYFFGFHIEEDGYIIFGEYGALVYAEGTFIMKLDFDGNVIWSEIMQPEVYQHIYRNNSIIELEDGYLIGGYGLIDSDPFGLLTKVNENGITLSEIAVVDEDEIKSQGMGVLRLENGDILVTQLFAYADVEEFDNPHVFWNKIRLYKFNPETEELIWLQDHLDNFEIMGGTADRIATPDGGALILGGSSGLDIGYYAWMLKIDSLGNQEWYREYTYEDCGFDCMNILYDVELAPDGGYIAAGSFTNWSVDPRNMSWLLKIDACGDVEWQDCQLTTVSAAKPENRIRLFPNPTEGEVFLEANLAVKSWQLFDLSGRQIESGSVSASAHQSIKFRNAATGAYLLKLVLQDGSTETHKLNIVR